MPDTVDQATRSSIMARVRSTDTGPEMRARRALHGAGYRFRLHRRDLPGSPDIVMLRHRTVVFVNGCFWHGHDCKRGARVPVTNRDYWVAKIGRNRARDASSRRALRRLGWRVNVVWECDLNRGVARVLGRLRGVAQASA